MPWLLFISSHGSYKVWKYGSKLGVTFTCAYGDSGGGGHHDLLISVTRSYHDAAAEHQETTGTHGQDELQTNVNSKRRSGPNAK